MDAQIEAWQGAGVDLASYSPEKYNILVPTTTTIQVNPLYSIRLVEVRGDPNPNGGDVFRVGSRTEDGVTIDLFSPQKPLVERLANAAGVVFHPTECRLVKRTPRYAYYTAVGARRMPSGEWSVAPGSKEIDLEVIEDEMRLQYEQKCSDAGFDASKKYKGEWVKETVRPKGKPAYDKNKYIVAPEDRERFISDMTRANMIQWRKNMVHRAETGAKLRVIRSLIGMKSTYTQNELQKPFVIATVDFAPDYRDQQVKNLAIRQGLQAMGALYGGAPTSIPTTVFEDAHELPEASDEVFDTAIADVDPAPTRSRSNPASGAYANEAQGGNSAQAQGGSQKNVDSEPEPEKTDDGVVRCQHEGCDRVLSLPEQGYSQKKCTGMYCMTHQRFHQKVGRS